MIFCRRCVADVQDTCGVKMHTWDPSVDKDITANVNTGEFKVNGNVL